MVVGARSRLAVECDGDRFHSKPEQIRRDQRRDRELQRVGWTFWRIRESEFRFDPDESLTGLWAELNQLGIHPATFDDAHSSTPSTAPSAVRWTPLDLSSDEDSTEDTAEAADTTDAADPLAVMQPAADEEPENITEGSKA